MNINREPYRNFTVVIELEDSTTIEVKVFAKTDWHAKDKAHSQHIRVQKDKAKYSIKKPVFGMV